MNAHINVDDDTRQEEAGMNDVLTLHDQARRLADIHETSHEYELDRKAREHGHTSWQAEGTVPGPLGPPRLSVDGS